MHAVAGPHESDILARKTDDKTRQQTNTVFSSHNGHRERKGPALDKSAQRKDKKELAVQRGGEHPGRGKSPARTPEVWEPQEPSIADEQ